MSTLSDYFQITGQGYHTPVESPDVTRITVLASTKTVVGGRLGPATVVVSLDTGKIISVVDRIVPESTFPAGTPYKDYSPFFLLPGLVDAHVHLNEPGRTEWEGFWTGTRAAAFGGVTTVIDMPLNAIPPTTTVANLNEKIAAAQGKCWVDVGFYGGIIPGNSEDLRGLVDAGVRGFKGFLIESGVEEFPAVSSTDIALAMEALKDEPTTLMFHAEMIPPISDSVGDAVQQSLPPLMPTGPLNSYQTFLNSRPPAFETYAIEEILSLAHIAPNLPLHIVHLSAIEAIPLLRAARQRGVKITAETCFHYLALSAEGVAEGDTRHKCCPPIRTQSNQDGLWDELKRCKSSAPSSTFPSSSSLASLDTALHAMTPPSESTLALSSSSRFNQQSDAVIHTVVSDHSPCTAGLKLLPSAANLDGEGDFFQAWGGISSVGLGLPILWTQAASRQITIVDIVRWCATNTAKQVGLETVKGDIAVGMDADLIVFDPETEWTVGHREMLFRNKCSPYEKRTLKGIVKETWLRGVKVFERENGFVNVVEGGSGLEMEAKPTGKLLLERRRWQKA